MRPDRSRERRVSFRSDDLSLEGVLSPPKGAGGDVIGVVVCHPHPLYGGTMENMVVWGICDAIASKGGMALRFNFRGVGDSEGRHDDGKGEVDDVLSAIGYLQDMSNVGRVRLAGYSFGSMMALKAALSNKDIDRVACVALPIVYFDEVDLGQRDDLDVLLIGGEEDDVAPPEGIERYGRTIGDRARMEMIPGSDHFFGGRTKAVGELVTDFLKEF